MAGRSVCFVVQVGDVSGGEQSAAALREVEGKPRRGGGCRPCLQGLKVRHFFSCI